MDLFFDLFSLIFAQNCQHIMLPWWLSGKRIHLQCRRCGFDPWVGKIICRRKWQPAPVVLLGKFHGQRSLDGYSPQGCKISDMTEWLSTHNAVLILFFPPSSYSFPKRPASLWLSYHTKHHLPWLFKEMCLSKTTVRKRESQGVGFNLWFPGGVTCKGKV